MANDTLIYITGGAFALAASGRVYIAIANARVNNPFEDNYFRKKLLAAYWNEIKSINKGSAYIVQFAEYLHQKFIVVTILSQLIHLNSRKISREEIENVFEVNRLFVVNSLLSLKIPSELKIDIIKTAQMQIINAKEDIIKVCESNKTNFRKKRLVGKILIQFATSNFRYSIAQFNITKETLKIDSKNLFSGAEVDNLIASGRIFDAIICMQAAGVQKGAVTQLLFRYSDYEADVIRGVHTTESKTVALNTITNSVIMLSEILKTETGLLLVVVFDFFVN